MLSYQINYLLKKNAIAVDFEELDFQIKTHPTYPSLHAITGVLDHFNIENLTVDSFVNSESYKQIFHTFIAQLITYLKLDFGLVNKYNISSCEE